MTTVTGPSAGPTSSRDGGAAPSQRPAAPGRLPRRTRALLAAPGALVVVVPLVLLVLLGHHSEPGRSEAVRALPATLADLPARQDGPADDVAEQLTDRLSDEPSVSDVAVRVYGEGDGVMVVLALTPQVPLTDSTAGELTARVLGAAGPQRGMSTDFRSSASDDGLALVTCSSPRPDAATCVSVEAGSALVVLTTGTDADPVELTARVRDELRGAPTAAGS